MTTTAATGAGTLEMPGVPVGGVRRTRGKNKAPAWRWDGPVAVIRLPLVVEEQATARLETLFSAMFALKRAVQRDARSRVAAFWTGTHRREEDAAGWRRELGLTRQGLERAAYGHLDASGWLRHHASKALALHQADEVWAGVERHLFPDASGKRAGRPRPGSWWEYTRIPGQAAALEPGTPVLAQPRRMPPPRPPASRTGKGSWWEHDGPLAVVFTGGPDSGRGELVLPVRLPQGAGRWPWLGHFLARPELWHKIDLVRRPHPSTPGGWVYEAHLMILDGGYTSTATRERRQHAAGLERVGGVDVNVGNLSLVSFPATLAPADGPVLADPCWRTRSPSPTWSAPLSSVNAAPPEDAPGRWSAPDGPSTRPATSCPGANANESGVGRTPGYPPATSTCPKDHAWPIRRAVPTPPTGTTASPTATGPCGPAPGPSRPAAPKPSTPAPGQPPPGSSPSTGRI